jgi:hypothetical protein
MKSSASLSLLSAGALVLAFVGSGIRTPVQAQSAPAQTEQTPQQSEQSRAQDRGPAEDVTIGRDWKAEEGGNSQAAAPAADQDHQTVGRDWRAHPDNHDR